MAKYFLNIRNGDFIEDAEGQDFPSPEAARDEAILAVRDLLIDDLKSQRGLQLSRRFEIVDGSGVLVAVVPFTDVVQK